jgi:hypothetical protein
MAVPSLLGGFDARLKPAALLAPWPGRINTTQAAFTTHNRHQQRRLRSARLARN